MTIRLVWEEEGALRVLPADVYLETELTSSAVPTEHAVEDGAVVSDHVRKAPRSLRLRILASNTPIAAVENLAGETLGAVGELELELPELGVGDGRGGVTLQRQSATVQTLQFDEEFDRVREVHETLQRLWSESTEVNVDVRVEALTSYVITDISTLDDERRGSSGIWAVSLRRITKVETQRVGAPPRVRPQPREPAHDREQNRGSAATEEASEERRASALAWLSGR